MSTFKKPSSKKYDKQDTSSRLELREDKIKHIKEKKKLATLVAKLQHSGLENELEEEGIVHSIIFLDDFIESIKSGTSKFVTNLKTRYDEIGTEFTPFNMSEEMDEGKFDETGHYLFHKRGAN